MLKWCGISNCAKRNLINVRFLILAKENNNFIYEKTDDKKF